MSFNQFGSLFSITTWGESHGKAIGVVVDGCPAGLAVDEESINLALARRAPGQSAFTTPRKEKDLARILSGVFQGVTTGAPISIMIENADADSSKYEAVKEILRPGHANYTYLQKFGVVDHRGGGRASARETACRVAAGAIAQKLLAEFGITVTAYVESVGNIAVTLPENLRISTLRECISQSALFTPDAAVQAQMEKAILEAIRNKDSIGGVVRFMAEGVPPGLGEPLYNKIEAMLASAMMSIPAAKGFEIGNGFAASTLHGSENNDTFLPGASIETKDTQENTYPHHLPLVQTATNRAGGCLGGITNGMPVHGRVAFKPTPSIGQPMETTDLQGKAATLTLPAGSRHDPCVVVRAVPVVEAMCMITLADAVLLHRARQANPCNTKAHQDFL